MKYEKKKILLLILFILLTTLIYMIWLKDFLTFEQFKIYRAELIQWVQGHMWESVILYIVLYLLIAGLSLPGLPVLTMAGAFVFGIIPATIYVLLAATTGAFIAFLLSRYLIGEWVQKKYKKHLITFNRQVDQHGKYYLLTLRLMPLFPFTWINLFCGLTPIKKMTFLWITFLGIFPGTLLNAYIGSLAGHINSPQEILSGGIFIGFFLLGLLAMIPVFYKHLARISHKRS